MHQGSMFHVVTTKALVLKIIDEINTYLLTYITYLFLLLLCPFALSNKMWTCLGRGWEEQCDLIWGKFKMKCLNRWRQKWRWSDPLELGYIIFSKTAFHSMQFVWKIPPKQDFENAIKTHLIVFSVKYDNMMKILNMSGLIIDSFCFH